MNVVNKVKEKMDERKFKKLEKKVIWLQGEISRLQDQQEKLKTAEPTKNSADGKCHSVIKKEPEKHANKKAGHDKGEVSSNTIRPDGLRKEDIQPSTTTIKEKAKQVKRVIPTNEGIKLEEICERQVQPTHFITGRPMNRSRKRCHFCRKRGHLQKDCLSKHMLRKWLRDEASEMFKNTLQ